ncbi:MAG: hypothetical protein JXQ90_09465 [Cyclobacteriaceae bacterium]
MSLDLNSIQNKQRVLITGNSGRHKIIKLAIHVLDHIGKPYDYYIDDTDCKLTDAPIIFIDGNDEKGSDGRAKFNQYDHHIAVIHRISKEAIPEGYVSHDDYTEQYELLADHTPKSGSIIYNKEDNVAMMVGEKERPDVHLLIYEPVENQKVADGFKVNGSIEINTTNDQFPAHLGAVKTLLNRVSVRDEQVYDSLKTFKD